MRSSKVTAESDPPRPGGTAQSAEGREILTWSGGSEGPRPGESRLGATRNALCEAKKRIRKKNRGAALSVRVSEHGIMT